MTGVRGETVGKGVGTAGYDVQVFEYDSDDGETWSLYGGRVDALSQVAPLLAEYVRFQCEDWLDQAAVPAGVPRDEKGLVCVADVPDDVLVDLYFSVFAGQEWWELAPARSHLPGPDMAGGVCLDAASLRAAAADCDASFYDPAFADAVAATSDNVLNAAVSEAVDDRFRAAYGEVCSRALGSVRQLLAAQVK